jgi:hypothetical protein
VLATDGCYVSADPVVQPRPHDLDAELDVDGDLGPARALAVERLADRGGGDGGGDLGDPPRPEALSPMAAAATSTPSASA